jgi:hypothetical protein
VIAKIRAPSIIGGVKRLNNGNLIKISLFRPKLQSAPV